MTSVDDVIRDPRFYQLAAAGQAVDGALCVGPIPYIRRCLEDVEFPMRYRWFFPVVKGASAVGLAAAPRSPGLARLTAIMLTLYFGVAVGMHIRARDLRLNFAAATSLLLFYGLLAASGPPRPAGSS
ncbi:DoxX family protein [Tsukamurella sp. 1534]|uniref:DoxX family protein n=1 Tax=Tsukamurella sp. 1534 TaxID=1151061 RepID=UPI0002F3B4F3|nr:DoxX family protein [Tsukamurella sp. 1534]